MKQILISTMLFLFAATAFAQDFSGDVHAQSSFLNRGRNLSEIPDFTGLPAGNIPSVGVTARVDNLLVDGLFVQGNFDTIKGGVLGKPDTVVRQEYHLGYQLALDRLTLTGEVVHLKNSPCYSFISYTEARVSAKYTVVDNVHVRGGVEWMVNPFPNDVYYYGAIDYDLSEDFTVGVLVSGYHYGDRAYPVNKNVFNNAEVYASYDVGNFTVSGLYSLGGDDLNKGYNAYPVWKVNNEWTVNLSYNF